MSATVIYWDDSAVGDEGWSWRNADDSGALACPETGDEFPQDIDEQTLIEAAEAYGLPDPVKVA